MAFIVTWQANGAYSERRTTPVANGSHSVSKKPQRLKDTRSGSVSSIGNGQGRKSESNQSVTASTVPVLDDEFVSETQVLIHVFPGD